MKKKRISDIVKIIEKLLPNESSNFTDEIKENIKQAIQDHLHSLDIELEKNLIFKTRFFLKQD